MERVENLCWESTEDTGTSPFSLTTVARSINDAYGTGGTDTFWVGMYNAAVPGEWMVATGHLSATSTLVIDTVIEGSNGTSEVSWSAGKKNIVVGTPAAYEFKFHTGTAAPSYASDLDFWLKTDTWQLFIYWNDGDTTQWIEVGGGGTALNVVTQVFTASGTYTPTTGMKWCIIECVGSGGGGGGVTGATSDIHVGGGGGSGGYSRTVASAADIGAQQTVTIGAAGTGGSGSNDGTAGSAVSVGTLCVANGGGGGLFSNAASNPGPGQGANTTSAVGDITAQGSPGEGGARNAAATTTYVPSGNGGPSYFGAGGSTPQALGNGGDGQYGSGGAGGSAVSAVTADGGDGGTGLVVITEFI